MQYYCIHVSLCQWCQWCLRCQGKKGKCYGTLLAGICVGSVFVLTLTPVTPLPLVMFVCKVVCLLTGWGGQMSHALFDLSLTPSRNEEGPLPMHRLPMNARCWAIRRTVRKG